MIVPDSPVPLEGYRIWGVVDSREGPRLQSATSGFCGGTTVWTPYEPFEASCLAKSSCAGAPNADHSCGIHSFKALEDALRWALDVARVRPVVIGSVRIWGKVVESSCGWRSQYAYPLALTSGVRHRELKPLAAAYGVACDD